MSDKIMEALSAMEDKLRECESILEVMNTRIEGLQDELKEAGSRWDMQGEG